LTLLALLALRFENKMKGQDDPPKILFLDEEAREDWIKFSLFIESRQGPEGDLRQIQDWTGKLPGAALRIAGLFHLVEYPDRRVIDKVVMDKSLDLCSILVDHAKAAFGIMGADVCVEDAKSILRHLKSNEISSFTQREIYRSVLKNDHISRTINALQILTDRNYLSEPLKSDTGGRPSIHYQVNPIVFQGVD
jgi:hypothetical protein